MTSNTIKEVAEFANSKLGAHGFHIIILVDGKNPQTVLKSSTLPEDMQIIALEHILAKLKSRQ